jgi:hypothetical protein
MMAKTSGGNITMNTQPEDQMENNSRLQIYQVLVYYNLPERINSTPSAAAILNCVVQSATLLLQ